MLDKINKKFKESDYYDLETTIKILNPIYKEYFGKGGSLKMKRDDMKLYKSVIIHGKKIEHDKCVNFPAKMIFIVEYRGEIEKILCDCKTRICYDRTNKIFKTYCEKCQTNRFPTKLWFKNKYGEDWEFKFNEYHTNKLIADGKTNYSKISQDLFNLLFENLKDKSDLYYATFNNEWFIRLNKKEAEILNQQIIFLDFKYKNKVIEFDGSYWHKESKEIDQIKDEIINSRNFKILRIKEEEYKNNKNETVEKCMRFLNDN